MLRMRGTTKREKRRRELGVVLCTMLVSHVVCIWYSLCTGYFQNICTYTLLDRRYHSTEYRSAYNESHLEYCRVIRAFQIGKQFSSFQDAEK